MGSSDSEKNGKFAASRIALRKTLRAIKKNTKKAARIGALATLGLSGAPQPVEAQKVSGEQVLTSAIESSKAEKEGMAPDPRLFEYSSQIKAIQAAYLKYLTAKSNTTDFYRKVIQLSQEIANKFFSMPEDMIINGEIVPRRIHIPLPVGFAKEFENGAKGYNVTLQVDSDISVNFTVAHNPNLPAYCERVAGDDIAVCDVSHESEGDFLPLEPIDLNAPVVVIGETDQYVGPAFDAEAFLKPIGTEKEPLLSVHNSKIDARYWPVDFEKVLHTKGTYCMVVPSAVEEDHLRSGTVVVQARKDTFGKKYVAAVGMQSLLAEIYFNDNADKVSPEKKVKLMCFIGSERMKAGAKKAFAK